MKRILLILSAVLISGIDAHAAFSPDDSKDPWKPGWDTKVSYAREILPILSDKCFHCHGPDKETREENLRLDIRSEAIKAFAWDPQNPEQSEALIRIFSDDPKEVMPPPKSHLTLAQREKDLLKRWVAEGAEYETHWAFVAPPKEIPIPETKDKSWAKNPIDSFILARLEKEGLNPSPEAPPERWLRRVTFDLTGLPPTQTEIDSFLTDISPEACETVVNRLLASPRFGECMATPWLDVARYADSSGYQADVDTESWPYRDWVIGAFNRNLPLDEFIIEQLAGDLLPEATREQKLATAFNRIHRKTNEGGSVPEEWRQEGVSDRVHTVATAFIGLTFECARCHDHKYDPVTMKDYYSLGAFFNSIDEFGLLQGGDVKGNIVAQPALLLPTTEQETQLAELSRKVAAAETELAVHIAGSEAAFGAWLASASTFASPDLVARFDFEDTPAAKSSKKESGLSLGGNRIAPGKDGNALHTDGDSITTLPSFGIEHAEQPFSFSLWIKPAEHKPRAFVFGNTTASGENHSGYSLVLEHGLATWTLARENPGCAISISTSHAIPTGEWTHITVTNDGSCKAAGLGIHINGKPAETHVLSDCLSHVMPTGGRITLAGRNRDAGLRGGMIDSLTIHHRALTQLEISGLAGVPANDGLTHDDHRAYYFSAVDPEARALMEKLSAARAAHREAQSAVREVSIMRESETPRPTFILHRGDYSRPTDPVGRETPSWLPSFPGKAPKNRLGLAWWLTSPDHPLTARVTINRVWQQVFGAGIVETSENFGLQGAQPSHPALLDWLARDLINHGWDHKRALKQMVLSATYRQDSAASDSLRKRDPHNHLLARGPSRRLSAEQLRDSALAFSGLLVDTTGGPPVKPYQAPGSMWKTLNNFLPEYRQDKGDGLYRRSLYTFWRRTTTPPNMMIFDATTRETCSTRRQATNTPLQPLVMLNDPTFVEAARKLGERILEKGGATDESRTKWAYREVTGKAPNSGQLPLLLDLVREQREFFKAAPADAAALLKVGDSPANPALDPVESATFAILAQALFNLDANITLR
ncbi:MAG: DUF1553 domain-containing protein [Luteolibacter sp.]